jgi:hypothetical protein
MLNPDEDTKKILLGVLIGGILGGGAFYLLHKRDKPVLNRISDTISHVGDILEECQTGTKDASKNVDNILTNAIDLASTGIHLWKKIKKGL